MCNLFVSKVNLKLKILFRVLSWGETQQRQDTSEIAVDWSGAKQMLGFAQEIKIFGLLGD